MNWKHKCKIEWLIARQNHLTATDVYDLLPVTKTGRKRNIGDEQKIKVYARKKAMLTGDDCVSVGAAARGHILEPYAIEQFNNAKMYSVELFHADDLLIAPSRKPGSLAFSPDALPFETASHGFTSAYEPAVIGEVKCYSAENHLMKGYTDKMDLEERWQIATAMAVCQSIELAYLILFNPSMNYSMFVVEYTREDLVDEIHVVLDVQKDWQLWLEGVRQLPHNQIVRAQYNDELQIIKRIMREEVLNPDSSKSVMQ